ncbi:MAG: type II toxin-antitoxin system VapC family toxin [Alphaproteobacteria bacterium]|nr:type II toxin-antitoxin system VapC family toxin [Alphaproteobacteria bacterium]
MIFVDTNILLDFLTDDPVWKPWSLAAYESSAASDRIAINDVVYAEISVRFVKMEDVETVLVRTALSVEPMRRAALFLAGKTYKAYRAAGGVRTGVLPDFVIGAHATVAQAALLTRDPRRYRTYFPGLKLIAPA